ncbi:hypothetical protein AN189_07380 [Loktanella sp. 3ANDIMAR09]|uniref:hypothetical protein n=1 Tax=Loktanella sp. 3ANDIMAR09 TaxID=1225657 RepID=UPI0006FD4414|nr:hypothetical protein [Loktanella sp. 3ANDIMAR09]KQI68713.1 hypothetical protein AN189_07380 [Loktanella sp. 3ANDIMAR09]
MAKTLKTDTVETVTLTRDKYRDAIGQINTAKEKAKEHNGVAASATKTFADDHALDKQALTTVAKLSKKEPPTQTTFLRELIQGADFMGMFAHRDAFDDDLISVMGRIVDREREREAQRQATNANGGDPVPAKAAPAMSVVQ